MGSRGWDRTLIAYFLNHLQVYTHTIWNIFRISTKIFPNWYIGKIGSKVKRRGFPFFLNLPLLGLSLISNFSKLISSNFFFSSNLNFHTLLLIVSLKIRNISLWENPGSWESIKNILKSLQYTERAVMRVMIIRITRLMIIRILHSRALICTFFNSSSCDCEVPISCWNCNYKKISISPAAGVYLPIFRESGTIEVNGSNSARNRKFGDSVSLV